MNETTPVMALTVESTPTLNDLEVVSITPNGGEIFANEPNTIEATIKNNGTSAVGAFNVVFTVNSVETTVSVSGLEANTSTTVKMTDEEIRSFGDEVTIVVVVDSDAAVSESDESNNRMEESITVVYNGYKGKRYTDGNDLETVATFEGWYDVLCSAGDTVYSNAEWTEKQFAWTETDLPVPEDATVVQARLYQGYTYNKKGSVPDYTLAFNGETVTPAERYTDRKNFGSYDYPYGLYVFNVTEQFNTSGNTMVITPESGNNYGIYGAYLVVVYENTSGTSKKIWINEEFDNLYAYAKYAVSSTEATAYANFSGVDASEIASATSVAILASAADEGKSKFFFNDEEYEGFWNDYQESPQIGFSVYDVTSDLTDGTNVVAMQSYDPTKGDNIYAMTSILTVEDAYIDLEVTKIAAIGGDMFANEPNTIEATIINKGSIAAGAFNVVFTVNGEETTVPVSGLDAGNTKIVNITDEEIRSFGDEVTIVVVVDSDAAVSESDESNNRMEESITVVYNGYKGKRYTDGNDLETVATFEGWYDVLYSAGDTVYSNAEWTEKQYAWTETDLPVPADATVVQARLYQGYTYNKKGSDPAYTLTFNNETVTPAEKYTDRKNFGSYDYPYGLYVFNVTEQFNTSGNTMVITPESGNNYGIYGAYLVVVYENTSGTSKKIWINEEFDNLYAYAKYAVNSTEATAYANFSGVDASEVASATSVAVLASAADEGKSKFFFNDEEYEGFWADYESDPQLGFSVYDVTSDLTNGTNVVAMQSYNPTKGDNMYAMTSILTVEDAYIDLEVESLSTNGGEMFANEPNTIEATIINKGSVAAGTFNVSFTVNDEVTIVQVSGLDAGTSIPINITDAEIRSLGDVVNITVLVDSDSAVSESNESNNEKEISKTVVYNGYKGKRYTDGNDLETVATFEGQYDVLYSAGDTVYCNAKWTEKQFNWTATDLLVPADATVVQARLYQGYTYNKKGSDPAYTLTFNGETVTPAEKYTDRKNFGSYDYPYGLYVFNVTEQFNTAGNTMVITPDADNNYGIYGAYLVVVYKNPAGASKSIWINEEFDNLYAYEKYAVSSTEATAYADFSDANSSNVILATSVAAMASAADEGKSKFFFNDEEYEGFWADYESDPQVGFSLYDVTSALRDGTNVVAMQSYDLTKGDNMYAMTSILEVVSGDGMAISLKPGWNFISTPKRLTSGLDTINIFNNVDTAGHSILLYNAQEYKWEAMSSDDPFKPLDGIWIYANKSYSVPIIFAQGTPATPPVKSLYSGWNVIGFSDTEPETAANTLLSVDDAWTTLIGFNATIQEYDVSIINGATGPRGDDRDMEALKGYWLFMTKNGNLSAISA